ncbi:hypothetical protein F511_09244 [Dorcoceras hygrometricum]|uniref:Uncharacterized protein n=1 Tax=Dorcoceras hygrometricum TaxID=472368 RepID=A0A2Z7AG20_9LAMI|nr:hypothetical protein F511_09244 [Dorcoceras hygrometricum]
MEVRISISYISPSSASEGSTRRFDLTPRVQTQSNSHQLRELLDSAPALGYVNHLFYVSVRKPTDTEFNVFVLGRDLVLNFGFDSLTIQFRTSLMFICSTKADFDSAVDTSDKLLSNGGRLLRLSVFLPYFFSLIFPASLDHTIFNSASCVSSFDQLLKCLRLNALKHLIAPTDTPTTDCLDIFILQQLITSTDPAVDFYVPVILYLTAEMFFFDLLITFDHQLLSSTNLYFMFNSCLLQLLTIPTVDCFSTSLLQRLSTPTAVSFSTAYLHQQLIIPRVD